jgi:hypothetical protein
VASVVTLSTGVVHRYIFELRYDFGHLYWDRCGRVINQIIASQEKWNFEKMGSGFCHLRSAEANLDFNYGWAKLDLMQSQDREVSSLLPIGEFGATAEALAGSVVSILQLDHFSRIGFRAHYLYPTSGLDQAHDVLKKLKLFSLHSELDQTLGTTSEASFRTVIQRPEQKVRIALSPFEQQINLSPGVVEAARTKARDRWKDQRKVLLAALKAQHMIKQFPQFGVLLDLDASIEEPPFPDSLSVSDFVSRAESEFRALMPRVLEAM